MPRRPRIALQDIPMHIIQRGNNRTPCFHANEDYRVYLRNLADLAARCACRVHAYVLMTNHVHLLITPEADGAASRLMKHLGQRHAQYVNRVHGRTGTLWEGRFRSCLIEEESYLISCYRYIEMNPVRAGMVANPSDYPWSSHGCNALGRPSRLLSPHPCYLDLGHDDLARRTAYVRLFDDESTGTVTDEIRRATNGNVVLGTARFQRVVAAVLGRRTSHGRPGRPRRGDGHEADCDETGDGKPAMGSDHVYAPTETKKTWSDPDFDLGQRPQSGAMR